MSIDCKSCRLENACDASAIFSSHARSKTSFFTDYRYGSAIFVRNKSMLAASTAAIHECQPSSRDQAHHTDTTTTVG